MSDVIVVGAGPTGLMLAAELVRAGVDVELFDRAKQRSEASRAAGMNARTMEVLDQRGMLHAFEAVGRPMAAGHFSGIALDTGSLPTRRPYTLGIMQADTERVLEQFAVPVQWDSEATAVEQDDTGVWVTIVGAEGVTRRRARYVVGCDGGRSAVRRLAGIPFDGTPARRITLLGDVEVDSPPAERTFLSRHDAGIVTFLPFGELSGGGWKRVMVTEYGASLDDSNPVTLDGMRGALRRVAGTDFGIHSARWLSRFADASRQAGRYHSGRIFLAGDAAHIHPPLGGQGMNMGMQDAVNLGWKLAAVLRGADDGLLDSYHEERHPVAARVMINTRAQTGLLDGGADVTAMRQTLEEILRVDAANERLSAEISGLDTCYGTGGHPLVGRRIPDGDIVIGTRPSRIYELLHPARPVLLDLGAGIETALDEQILVVRADCPVRRWRLPVVGWVTVPAALLIRPDGHVAWVSTDGSEDGLRRSAEQIGVPSALDPVGPGVDVHRLAAQESHQGQA
ncbi:FAD-dependent monooxygenase [Mycobacterium sp. 21AC1]|uniref:FAD-dependent oxidoreductase n=1 Tax=[Mycobacterium] appelbergii TaxID=2939269 RepID=UPI002938F263|nr:FAD-dependent oxidoreductase [Mycobacterium sp. 21AC1]MDV3127697.1 FAD-dependent monooxygenase [Mycobacterium sp. 21AC1]